MIKRSIARRYARALLELVDTDPAPVNKQLSEFQQTVSENPNLSHLLSSPVFSVEERERVLKALQARLSIATPLDRFLQLLVDRRRLAYLPAIAESFQELVDAKAGKVRVQVDSADPLEETVAARLKAVLATSLGKEIILLKRTDPDLLAGVSLRIGGLLVDGSLKTQLRRLSEKLVARRP